MFTPEHLRAAHDAAIASLDPSQRRALDDLVAAASPMRSADHVVQQRLDAIFRREAVALNKAMAAPKPA